MSEVHRDRVAERIPIELIEADFEIAFNLVDMFQAEFEKADRASASRALGDAEDVFEDIERRLTLIGRANSQTFDELTGELKRMISVAKSQCE